MCGFGWLCWVIRSSRNRILFSGAFVDIKEMVYTVKLKAWEWFVVFYKNYNHNFELVGIACNVFLVLVIVFFNWIGVPIIVFLTHFACNKK